MARYVVVVVPALTDADGNTMYVCACVRPAELQHQESEGSVATVSSVS